MGLTRQQKYDFQRREAEKYVKYKAIMKDRWEQLETEWKEKARTMEMMLEATYDREKNYFRKQVPHAPDSPYLEFIYFDCKGNRISRDELDEQEFRRPW